MKKINSNGYGVRMVFVIALFLVILPLFGYILQLFPGGEWTRPLMKISIGLGVCLLLLMVLLLSVELHQDKRLNRYYQVHRNRKLPLTDGHYECQACGNRLLHAEDKRCGVCGCHFEE